MSDLSIAVVCLSNINCSMEAHAFLDEKGFKVKSFGSGDKVRLPGTSVHDPNCYDFGVLYKDIYNDLIKKDPKFYTQNGLLDMLDRNSKIKLFPERFQKSTERFDVIVTCEEIVYDEVIEWFSSNRPVHSEPVHIINIDIKDTPEEATTGAFLICDLIMKMSNSTDLNSNINKLLLDFEAMCQRPIFNCVMFY